MWEKDSESKVKSCLRRTEVSRFHSRRIKKKTAASQFYRAKYRTRSHIVERGCHIEQRLMMTQLELIMVILIIRKPIFF
ncbi:hypothetical protein Avbf_05294 [Armadillidium vulgare]|nr:hypothetical protein Avbf_05294 [Armadillidium vulgare]